MAHDEDAFVKVLERIMDGESLKQICDDKDMPVRSTIYLWLAGDASLSDRYARACEIRADGIFDELFEIADDGHNDWMLRKYGDDERWVENGEAIRRSALRIDARKWSLAKMQPKKYGDKVAIGGAEDLPPIKTEDTSASAMLRAHIDTIRSRATGVSE